MVQIDREKLERQVKEVYKEVAERPDGEFHFKMGRELADELGYDPAHLDAVPEQALDSFAGVGYHLGLAQPKPGERVLDLGCGSGMCVFYIASLVTEEGHVTGIDMTTAQLKKARQQADDAGITNVTFRDGYIEDIPFKDNSFDLVVSNGVINLSADKQRVFEEAHRVLSSDGRLAVSDIISEQAMPESITSDADLWAACIGGAMQVDKYLGLIESTGFAVEEWQENTQYQFTSSQAKNACEKYGIKSISLLATKR